MPDATTKPISRQSAHQNARIAAGRCGSCGATPLATKRQCLACAVRRREYAAARKGTKSTYNCLTRRMEMKSQTTQPIQDHAQEPTTPVQAD